MKLLAALVAAACASAVSAHGIVDTFTANGKSYKGPGPVEETSPKMPDSPIRQVYSNGPTHDVNGSDMACGVGTTGVTTNGVAKVSAGSDVQLQFTPWPHEEGPVTAYLGKCPGEASDCDGTQLKWFKIDQRSYNPDTQRWYQGDVIAKGKPGVVTIPAGLEDGVYLLRYEIIALHLAQQIGGAEFFISCTQIEVVDGGNASPSGDLLVSFPGAYKADDPGLYVDIYTDFHSYSNPGPALFVPGDSAPAPPDTPDPTSSEQPEPTPTDVPEEPTSTESEPTSTDTESEPTSPPKPTKPVLTPPGPVKPPPPDTNDPPILDPTPPQSPEEPEQPETPPQAPQEPEVPPPPPSTCRKRRHRRRMRRNH